MPVDVDAIIMLSDAQQQQSAASDSGTIDNWTRAMPNATVLGELASAAPSGSSSGIERVATATITELLGEIHRGNASAYDALLPLVYDELKRVASRSLSNEQEGHTLQPTALVHEAYLRLVDQRTPNFENRRHFYSVSAGLMRQILVDHARRANAAKRGARTVIPLEASMDAAVAEPAQYEILDLDDAIRQLALRDPRQAQIVELRFFAGLSVEETATVLNVSDRTVKREWAVARAFLYRALADAADPGNA